MLAGSLLVAAVGCTRQAVAEPGAGELDHDWPAAIAGGACTLLNYETVEAATGTRFDASAAAETSDTNTCALTVDGSAYPDLTLAVTPSEVDDGTFRAVMVPPGSAPVAYLGTEAYRTTEAAKNGTGPVVEVGWLSENGRLMVLRYTFPPQAVEADVAAVASRLAELAKLVDRGASA